MILEAAEKHARAVRALFAQPWARDIVEKVTRQCRLRKCPTEGELFELRFGYELYLTGITPIRQFKGGVGNTDIDFRVPGSPPWNIELVSVDESEAIKKSWIPNEEIRGIRIETSYLGLSGNHIIDADRNKDKQTPEYDMLRLISNLGKKVSDKRKKQPIKFPIPDGTFVNMILIDVRSYLGGDGMIDENDCRQILYGPRGLRNDWDVCWDPKSNQPIHGLFDSENKRPEALEAQKRIHVVGFVHEETFSDDEIREVTRLFPNPCLPIKLEQNPLGWPLNNAQRDGLRKKNPLWNLG